MLSELLVRGGKIVYGIEPNDDMRAIADIQLAKHPNFNSIRGSAESTTLARNSVDFVMAAQSFHWFDPIRAKEEFRRILRPNGRVVLIWNTRKTTTPFLHAHNQLLESASINKR